MKKIFENSHAQMYDISNEIPQTILVYWKGYLVTDEDGAMMACKESLKYFEEENILVMISDCKELKGSSLEFVDWLHEYYYPNAQKYGFKAEIVIESEHDMGNIALDLMLDSKEVNKNIQSGEVYTPQVDTLEGAKVLAQKIVEESNTKESK